MADANTGSAGTLRITASEASSNAAANTSVVSWQLWLIERVASNQTYSNNPTSASVALDGIGTVWSGSFTFDWRTSGLQSTLIASGSTTVGHNGDGSGSTTATGSIGSTGTSGAGGPTSVAQGVALTTLKVIPGTPTSVTAAWNSDTQATVSWAQSSASNGQPVSNTVRQQVNGGSWVTGATFSPTTSVVVAAAANRKTIYAILATNSAGDSAWSASSAAVFTTPGAPTDVAAAKDASLNIVVTFAPHVAFTEHQHVVTHGSVVGGTITWDGSALATLPAGTSSYTHATPNASVQHVYRVRARNTNTAALASAEVVSNTVQLLTAPNKPTLPVLGPNVDAGKAFVVTWTHNPVDTTPQKSYEVSYSINGGSTWASTGKVNASTSTRTFAANAYTAGQALTIRVRTWGSATSGGSDSAGASPWSDVQTVTFKSRPVVTISAPTNGGTWTEASLAVALGFTQAQGASFVQATIQLKQGATLLESIVSTTLASTLLATQVADGVSYVVSVAVLDSNGLVSDSTSSTFAVNYTNPITAGIVATYLPESGLTQLDLTFPAPGSDEAEAVAVIITRTIDGFTETVLGRYTITHSLLTVLDTTPTIHGVNTYTVTTISDDGATVDALRQLETSEKVWAFLSTGAGFVNIVTFSGDLEFSAAPARSVSLVATAGRGRPIALFGENGSLEVSGSATLTAGLGSTPKEMERFILAAGIVCYRDPSGRRIFGALKGSIDSPSSSASGFAFTVSEAS